MTEVLSEQFQPGEGSKQPSPAEQRGRRVRESEKRRLKDSRDPNDTHEPHDSALAACVKTLPEAARLALDWQGYGDGVFIFARAIRAFEVTNGRKLSDSELGVAFATWWSMAKNELPPDTDFDETRFQFMHALTKVKTPLGANVLEAAISQAESTPPPSEAARFESPKIKRLIHLCHELQKLAGDAPFFLSVRCAGKAIGCQRTEAASAFLNGLVRDGILSLVTKGTPGGHQASRFRYNRTPQKE